MKCTKCGLREATTEVLKRHNNHVEKMYLCDECASEYRNENVFDGFGLFGKLFNSSPTGLLGSLNGLFESPVEKKAVCQCCGTTSDEFLSTGYVGCPHCYETFEPLISQTLGKIQQSDRHVGKVPVGAPKISDEVARLKSELHIAVDKGDFVKIAEINSKLEKLTGGNGEGV